MFWSLEGRRCRVSMCMCLFDCCLSRPDPTDLADALGGMGLADKARIFVPVNNNPLSETPGGSHWCVLVRVRRQTFAG